MLEAEVAALLSSSPRSLAALPEPTQEQLQLAESFIERGSHTPHAISPLALARVRSQREVKATVESLICKLERQAEQDEMEPLERAEEQRWELVDWFHSLDLYIPKEGPASWRTEVEAAWSACHPDQELEWPDDYSEQCTMYLQWCVPRVRSDQQQSQEWPQEWPIGPGLPSPRGV